MFSLTSAFPTQLMWWMRPFQLRKHWELWMYIYIYMYIQSSQCYIYIYTYFRTGTLLLSHCFTNSFTCLVWQLFGTCTRQCVIWIFIQRNIIQNTVLLSQRIVLYKALGLDTWSRFVLVCYIAQFAQSSSIWDCWCSYRIGSLGPLSGRRRLPLQDRTALLITMITIHGPLLLTWLNVIPEITCPVWDEITYPFPNFNGFTVNDWEWTNNFTPYFIMVIIIYSCCVDRWYMLVKRPPVALMAWNFYN